MDKMEYIYESPDGKRIFRRECGVVEREEVVAGKWVTEVKEWKKAQ